jgi:hypothetical protein
VQCAAEEVRVLSTFAKNSTSYLTANAYTSRSIRHLTEKDKTGIELEKSDKTSRQPNTWPRGIYISLLPRLKKETLNMMPKAKH